MKITGGQILKVSAEKTKNAQNEGTVVNIAINNMSMEKEKLTINYTYTVQYTPDMGKISVTGEIYATETEKVVKELLEQWTKTKILPDNVASDIVTAATYAGSAVGTLLAFAVSIPSPINIQKARIQSPKETQKAA